MPSFPPFAAILLLLWELQRELASLSRWPSPKPVGNCPVALRGALKEFLIYPARAR
jgi:hypothetical protein